MTFPSFALSLGGMWIFIITVFMAVLVVLLVAGRQRYHR